MQKMLKLVLVVSLAFISMMAFKLPSSRNAIRLLKISNISRNLFGNPEPPKNTNPTNVKKDQGLFGGMGNFMDSLKKAQEIAKQAQDLNQELAATAFSGQDPSGQVTAVFNGLGAPISIKVSESLCSQGAEAVSLASSQAMLDAHMKSQQAMMVRMQNLYAASGVSPPK